MFSVFKMEVRKNGAQLIIFIENCSIDRREKNVFYINVGIPGNSRQVSFPIPHRYQVYDYDRVKDNT